MRFFIQLLLVLGICLFGTETYSQTSTGSTFIHLDQFGYFPSSRKVAVIGDPQVGFNASSSFTPAATYELRKVGTGAIVWSGSPQSWNGGATHDQSGDRGWWLDFSSVTATGDYYLYDPVGDIQSHSFRIGIDVYHEVLKQAMRTYFYQRLSYNKATPYADSRWADGPVFDGADQDRGARSRWAKTDPSTARDVHGGWMDAGDKNKYTTYAESAVQQLLHAFRTSPGVFGDDYNIPESGNGIPDILDEIMYELDWLKRMQDASGTDGLLLKVGVDNYAGYVPPSTDPRPRYYIPECTSATLAGASMFAMAGVVLQQSGIVSLQSYASDLINRAEAAFARALVTTNNFTSFEMNCDDQDIKSGDADPPSVEQQWESGFKAAVYLYEATDNTTYRDWVDVLINEVRPYKFNWWGPYQNQAAVAMLNYTRLPGATASLVSQILQQKSGMDYLFSINDYNNQTDLYRAYMPDAQHHWGSNQTRANSGNSNLDFIDFDINSGNRDTYLEVAEQYLHFFHGTNPLGKVMLSNMYDFGADSSVNEIYHTWFDNNTIYDHAIRSTNGPAPGYLTGGPNFTYANSSVTPPYGQPAQKSYRDWNTGFPEDSWEITEPAIYYQAAYVLLLSRIIASGAIALPVNDLQFSATKVKNTVELDWSTQGEWNNDFFLIEKSRDGFNWKPLHKRTGAGNTQVAQHYTYVDQSPFYGANYYRLLQQDFDGKKSYSQIIYLEFGDAPKLAISPNPATTQIQVRLDHQQSPTQAIAIIDATGRVVQESFIRRGEIAQISISQLPHGMYWVRAKQPNGWITKRFVK